MQTASNAGHTLARASTSTFQAADATDDDAQKQELLQQAQTLAACSGLADAYSFLQKAVGLIAVTLPFVVAIGSELAGGHGLKGSISAYYYTHLGNYFVGSLCALGVFFLSYNYRPLPQYRLDNYLSNIAAAMAVGVALFPTASDAATAKGGAETIAVLHLVFAGTLFVLLAVFSLFLFTKTNDPNHITPQKRRRNAVFRTSGVIIVAALVGIVITHIVPPPDGWHAFFWFESIAVVAFGVSWLVKGEFLGLFADPSGA